jgi:hypothetical protein
MSVVTIIEVGTTPTKIAEAPGPQQQTCTVSVEEGEPITIGGSTVALGEGIQLTREHPPVPFTMNGDDLFAVVPSGKSKIVVLTTVSGPIT